MSVFIHTQVRLWARNSVWHSFTSANQSNASGNNALKSTCCTAYTPRPQKSSIKMGPLDCISAHAVSNDGNDDYELQAKPGDKISAFVHNI